MSEEPKRWPVRRVDLPWLPPMSEGWMSDGEVAAMLGFAVILDRAEVPGGLLEVGAYRGRTTAALALASPRERSVVVVDTFQGGEDLPEEDSRQHFVTNMSRCLGPSMTSIEIRAGDSRVVLPELAKESRTFRLALIDGSHTEEGALADFENAWPMIAPGGVMFIDDANWPSVARAAKRFLGEGAARRKDAAPSSLTPKVAYMRKVPA